MMDADRREWPAEALSRGAREQLYLAFRIALVEDLGERKAALPLVLDDILVNFDPARAEAALDLLARLADTHQVLALTCHERVRDAFAQRGAGVLELSASQLSQLEGPGRVARAG